MTVIYSPNRDMRATVAEHGGQWYVSLEDIDDNRIFLVGRNVFANEATALAYAKECIRCTL